MNGFLAALGLVMSGTICAQAIGTACLPRTWRKKTRGEHFANGLDILFCCITGLAWMGTWYLGEHSTARAFTFMTGAGAWHYAKTKESFDKNQNPYSKSNLFGCWRWMTAFFMAGLMFDFVAVVYHDSTVLLSLSVPAMVAGIAYSFGAWRKERQEQQAAKAE